MANLKEIAELAWLQLYPKPSDETAVTKEEFIATAKAEFAYQELLMAWKEKREEGYFNVPSYLSTEIELEVKDNEMDISALKILRSLPQEVWLQNIGGLDCKCKYVKSTINLTQLLGDDDSMGDNVRTYLVVRKTIKFPQGVHTSPLTIIYANSGEDVDGRIEVDGAIAAIIRTRLIEIYGGKTGQEDETNNSNSNN